MATTELHSRRCNNRRKNTTTNNNNNNEDENGVSNGYYYDDENDDENDNDGKMYKSSCSMGQFFINPCLCLCTQCATCLRAIIGQKHHRRHTTTTTTKPASQQRRKQQQQQPIQTLINLLLPKPRNANAKEPPVPIAAITTIVVMVTMALAAKQRGRHNHPLRPCSGWELDQMPLLLHRFDARRSSTHDTRSNGGGTGYIIGGGGDTSDIGGWISEAGKKPFYSRGYLPKLRGTEHDDASNSTKRSVPDYGGLLFRSLRFAKQFRRTIHPRDYQLNEFERESVLYYNGSSNHTKQNAREERISKRYWFDDELEDTPTECRRSNWMMSQFPTCNFFHEIYLGRPYDIVLASRIGDASQDYLDSKYISHGYFRDVFILQSHNNATKTNNNKNNNREVGTLGEDGSSSSSNNNNGVDDLAVLKIARLKKEEFKFNFRTILNARRDALIMERLTSSEYIIDIYGYCSTSILAEALPNELEEKIVPNGEGYVTDEEELRELHDTSQNNNNNNKEDGSHNLSKNNFTVEEKLDIALRMAESIATLHGYKDGMIVHDDIQLCQWLRDPTGRIMKLGDFNRARVMEWDEKNKEYCKYNNGGAYGNWRSPEEYASKDLDEKIDVYSFGNNIYALLTGLWVYYDNDNDDEIRGFMAKDNPKKPYIDPRYRTGSYGEKKLVQVMERCWEFDPQKRIDIFQVVRLLRLARARTKNGLSQQ